MPGEEILKAFQEFRKAISITEDCSKLFGEFYRTYSYKNKIVLVELDNARMYIENINVLYNYIMGKCEGVLSLKFFTEEIFKMFIDGNVSNFEIIELHFSRMPLIEYTFIRPLQGVLLQTNILEKGKFAFINPGYLKEYIVTKNYASNFEHLDRYVAEFDKCCFVEMHCKAIDYDKAVEISDLFCKQLDKLLRYMFGHR